MTKLANIDLLLPCEFRSFEELADLVVGWNPDFRQMSHARNMSMVFQTQTDSMIITRARFGCQVNQLGSTPSGMRTFAILNTPGRQLHFFGHSIEQDYLLVFPANNDLQSFSQAGFDVSTFSVPVDLLKEYLDTDEPTGCKNMLTAAESLFPLMPWQMKQFRMLLNRAAIVAVKQDSCSQAKINSVIQEEILSLLLDVLCGPSRYSVAASDRKLKDILEYIDL
ncbi:MAG: hypothetical protein GY732_06260, partial [Gammaproteobacteria bacterium]|nr:hypothetical protein [Gammaproteobacteria bacterium]